MKRLLYISAQAVFVCQLLILFLLFFEDKVQVPVLLQPLGRMHPLILHFPIGLFVLLGVLELFKKEFEANSFDKLRRFLLHFTALTTSLSALMGFFLSREGGYGDDLMFWHKWTGAGLSFLAYGLLYVEKWSENKGLFFQVSLGISLVLLVFAGHFGASLTHGEDFVLEPLREDKEVRFDENAPIYQSAIFPVLESKCFSCHNEDKSKGELIMTSNDQLLKGGEHGPIWQAGSADSSLMYQRLLLPMTEKKHMPPKGKPQLEAMDIALIAAWLNEGADMEKPLASFDTESEFYALAQKKLDRIYRSTTAPNYTFDFASKEIIEELNTPFFTLVSNTYNSPALHANFYVQQAYDPQKLTELSKVKEQLVYLNLMNMPIGDTEIEQLSQFANLEKLILNGTQITGKTLDKLQTLTKLRSLALSSTELDAETAESVLRSFENVEELFIWNTKINSEEVESLISKFPAVKIYQGYVPDDNEKLKLGNPRLVNENFILASDETVKFKHNLPGSSIRYTLDGSAPDSSSTLYEKPFSINSFTVIKAREFLENWETSDVSSFTFFQKGTVPTKAELTHEPNVKYKGRGSVSLFDGTKGDAGAFTGDSWLGYKDKPFESWIFYENPPAISHLTLSYALNRVSYIMEPVSVEIWGGNDKKSMKLIKKERLPQAKDYGTNRVAGIDLQFNPTTFSHYKVVAEPLRKLPSWHRGKGDKAWVFIDELFLY